MKYNSEKIKEVLNHDCFKKAGYFDGTLEDFMAECLKELWREGENFSGKRPICDSGWEDIAGEALSILDPKIGKYNSDDEYFEVTNQELYLIVFNWLVEYIFFKDI